MGIRYYDEAISNKIKGWIRDPNLVILKPDEVSRLWQIRADQENDRPLTLPLIAISREPSITVAVPTKNDLSSRGRIVIAYIENSPILRLIKENSKHIDDGKFIADGSILERPLINLIGCSADDFLKVELTKIGFVKQDSGEYTLDGSKHKIHAHKENNEIVVTFDHITVRCLTEQEVPTDKGALQLNAIPVDINYQIDIYTRKYEEGDEYLRNFIFGLVEHPKMVVTLPYNGANLEHVCYTRLDGNVVDNSNISEKLFPDQFTRWSLKLSIQDAYLFSLPFKEFPRIGSVSLEVRDDFSVDSPVVDEVIIK